MMMMMMDWALSGNNNVEPSHTDGGRRRTKSRERRQQCCLFRSFVPCYLSIFMFSLLFGSQGPLGRDSVTSLWLAGMGIIVTSFFCLFCFSRDIEVTFWYWILASPENVLFCFNSQRCPCSVVLHPVTSCLRHVHLLAPSTKSNPLTPFKTSGFLFDISPISHLDFKHHTAILQICHRILIGYSALRSGRISRLV